MKNIFLLVISLIFLSACSTTSVKIEKSEGLVFHFGDDKSILASHIIETKEKKFTNLDVKQYVIQDDNSRVLFYEDVIFNRKMKNTLLQTLEYIFAADKAYEIYSRDNIIMVQLEAGEREHINVIAQSIGSSSLSYVYGISNYEFMKIVEKIKKDPNDKVERLNSQGITLNAFDMGLTRWSKGLLRIHPLVK